MLAREVRVRDGMESTYPVTPDGHAGPCPELVEDFHGRFPCVGLGHVLDEVCVLEEAWECF